jgi:hypothetical protein
LRHLGQQENTMRKAVTLMVLIASLGLGACMGAAPEPGHSAANLQQGVTVLEAGNGSLSLAYRDGDAVIFMEALRGNPSPYHDEPTMPAFEVDARFVSDEGSTFYSRQGGDNLVQPSWAEEMDRQTAQPASRQSNEQQFLMAGAAAELIHAAVVAQLGAARAAELAPELEALHESAAAMPRIYADSVAQRREWYLANEGVEPVEGPGGEVVFGTPGVDDESARTFRQSYYFVGVHKKCIYLCAGDHSATQIHEWLGYWAHVHDFCNHGTCASSMDRHGILQWNEPTVDTTRSWTAQTCGTHYDWDSGGGGHNCHDDSRMQMNNFVYNRQLSRTSYWCADSSTNKWKAPAANGSRYSGYNHPNYCQYNFSNDGASSCPSSYQGTGDGCDCGCRFPDGTHADPDCRP